MVTCSLVAGTLVDMVEPRADALGASAILAAQQIWPNGRSHDNLGGNHGNQSRSLS